MKSCIKFGSGHLQARYRSRPTTRRGSQEAMREANEVDDISDDEDGDAQSSSCNLVEIILKLLEDCDYNIRVDHLSPAGRVHLLTEVTSAKAFSTVRPLTLTRLAAQSKAPGPRPSEQTTR